MKTLFQGKTKWGVIYFNFTHQKLNRFDLFLIQKNKSSLFCFIEYKMLSPDQLYGLVRVHIFQYGPVQIQIFQLVFFQYGPFQIQIFQMDIFNMD